MLMCHGYTDLEAHYIPSGDSEKDKNDLFQQDPEHCYCYYITYVLLVLIIRLLYTVSNTVYRGRAVLSVI